MTPGAPTEETSPEAIAFVLADRVIAEQGTAPTAGEQFEHTIEIGTQYAAIVAPELARGVRNRVADAMIPVLRAAFGEQFSFSVSVEGPSVRISADTEYTDRASC